MNESTGWSSLLAKPIKRYNNILDDTRAQAADPPRMRTHLALAAADQAVAALAALRGPSECVDFFAQIQPLVTNIGQGLSMFPDSVDSRSMMTIFCISAFSETVGAPLEPIEFDVNQKLEEIVGIRDAPPRDRITAILICLNFGRMNDVALLPARTEPAASNLIKLLDAALDSTQASKDVEPAWDAYLRAFPQALVDETVEWRHLLLAARLAMGKLGGVPAGEVAWRLHQRIQQLATEESA